jgi:hypothetical protein
MHVLRQVKYAIRSYKRFVIAVVVISLHCGQDAVWIQNIYPPSTTLMIHSSRTITITITVAISFRLLLMSISPSSHWHDPKC